MVQLYETIGHNIPFYLFVFPREAEGQKKKNRGGSCFVLLYFPIGAVIKKYFPRFKIFGSQKILRRH